MKTNGSAGGRGAGEGNVSEAHRTSSGGADMARERGNLKNKQVEKLIRAGKPGNHYDGRGLRLEIRGSNSASWTTRYQIDGVTRYMGLGSAFDFTLAEARERNRKLARQKIADGIDPVLARQAEHAAKLAADAKALTFSEACRRFLEQHSAKWDSPKHRAQWQNTLKTYAEPIIGPLPVADIDVPLVLRVLEQPIEAARGFPAGPLWLSRPETANRGPRPHRDRPRLVQGARLPPRRQPGRLADHR